VNTLFSRSAFARFIAGSAAALAGTAPAVASAADMKPHRLALHVDQNDEKIMNLTLNNLTNAVKYYHDKGATITVEVVAYGQGLHMFRADDSPVKERLTSIKAANPDVVFSACNNTKMSMEAMEGHPIELVPEAHLTPAGIVRLIELQEAGYSYVKP